VWERCEDVWHDGYNCAPMGYKSACRPRRFLEPPSTAPPLGLPLWARPRQPGLRFRLQSGWTKVMPKTCFTPAAQHARSEAGTSGPSPFNENSSIIIAI
jgi:hypothetical protein